MHAILVSILILLYLVNEKFLIQATEQLAGEQSFPCGDREISDPIISPEPGEFWKFNQTNFEIRLRIIPQDCKYRYVVTSIAIMLPSEQSEVYLAYYKYRLGSTNIMELFTNMSTVNMDNVTISPLLLEELWVTKSVK